MRAFFYDHYFLYIVVMNSIDLEKLKFPIGEFETPTNYSTENIESWVQSIALFPTRIKEITEKLTREELNWKYRPEGWSIKQVVHHCADSHMNSIIRFKLGLTEDNATIRPYFEDRWANLIDGNDDEVSDSLILLEGLHGKWAKLLRSFSNDDYTKEVVHPEHGRKFSLQELIAMYAWHCDHHLAHIQIGIESKGRYN